MEQLIKAVINDRHHVDVTEMDDLDIIEVGENAYQLIHDSRTYNIRLTVYNRIKKSVSFMIDDTPYQVDLKDQVDATIDKMGLNDVIIGGAEDCMAPMPGLVLDVYTNVGDQVEAGDPLVILEAMKMENVIKAEHDGVISEVLVKSGDKVEKGQKMVAFE